MSAKGIQSDFGDEEQITSHRASTPAGYALTECPGASENSCSCCSANVTGAGNEGELVNPEHPPCAVIFGDPDADTDS